MIPIFNISRELWKQKPQQWGNFSDVQSGLFHNAEKMGIDPASIELAMPMWNPGDQRDYSKNGLVGTNTGATFTKNALLFNSGQYVSTDKTFQLIESTIFGIITSTSSSTAERYFFGGGASGQLFQIGIYTNLARFFCTVEGNTRAISFSTVSVGEETSLAVTSSSSISRVFKDGSFISSVSQYIPSLSATNPDIGGRFYDSSHSTPLLGYLHLLLYFDAILKDSQISLLSDNPYALWQPRTPTFYSFPSVSSGYRIRYGTATDTYETAEITDTEYIQTGLDPGTLYMAQVQAYEGDDDSAWTDWVEVYTDALAAYNRRRRLLLGGYR